MFDRIRHYLVASSDAPDESKGVADSICDGIDDQVEINASPGGIQQDLDAISPVMQHYYWALRWQEVEREARDALGHGDTGRVRVSPPAAEWLQTEAASRRNRTGPNV